jgi:hypothetical protein
MVYGHFSVCWCLPVWQAFLLKLTGHFSTGRKKRVKKRDCQPVELLPNETSEATTVPTAKSPMNIDNVVFTL